MDVVDPEAPYGRKKDGTPRKPNGGQQGIGARLLKAARRDRTTKTLRGVREGKVNPKPQDTRAKPGLEASLFGCELPTRKDQLPKESNQAFRCFVAYCELGPRRTIGEVMRRMRWHGVQLSYDDVLDWHGEHRWDERFEKWESREIERIKVRVKATAEKLKPHDLDLADRLERAALRCLNRANAGLELSTKDAAAVVKVAFDIRRVALGEATEITQEIADPEMVTALREFKERYGSLSMAELERKRAELAARDSDSSGGVRPQASHGGDPASEESGPDADRPIGEAGIIH